MPQPHAELEPEVWIILATDRLAEHNAAVYACEPDGRVRLSPPYAEFASQTDATAQLRSWRADSNQEFASKRILRDNDYTYTPFRSV